MRSEENEDRMKWDPSDVHQHSFFWEHRHWRERNTMRVRVKCYSCPQPQHVTTMCTFCLLELDFEMKFSTTNTIAISPHFHKKCTHKAAYLIIQSSWLIKRQEMEEKVPEVWHVPPAVCHTPWSQTPLASSWTQSPPWHGTVLSNKWMMLWSKISNILLP